jgi:hypothetical protein
MQKIRHLEIIIFDKVRKTTMKAMRAPTKKCARGKRFVQDCANVCILDLRKHWEVLELPSKRDVCPAQ